MTQNTETAESLWTAQEVAHFLKVSRSWVYHRVESGRLPHVRIGAMVRFHPHEIRACVAKLNSEPARVPNLNSSPRALRTRSRG